jgi:hypothetical protein
MTPRAIRENSFEAIAIDLISRLNDARKAYVEAALRPLETRTVEIAAKAGSNLYSVTSWKAFSRMKSKYIK